MPLNQRIRIQQILIAVFVLFACLTDPLLAGSGAGTAAYGFGLACVVVSVAGRTWCTYHIGSRKNAVLVRSGPYAVCRNPLYLFSLFGAAGFGLLHGSLIFAAAITASWYLIVLRTIEIEENRLPLDFGEEYRHYFQTVPRLLPLRISNWKNLSSGREGRAALRPRHYLDSLLILLLIPLAQLAEFARTAGGLSIWHLP